MALKKQQYWEVHFHEWRKDNVLTNGLPKKPGPVSWDKVTYLRGSLAGMVTWRLVRHVKHWLRLREGPVYFDCTPAEFKAIFYNNGLNEESHGIIIRTHENRVTVLITCM